MNKKQYSFFILFFFALFLAGNTLGQVFSEITKNYCTDSIHCRVQFIISDKSYKNIRSSRGSKLSFSDVQLHYNGSEIPVKSLITRGKTTLYFPKKSFTLKLKKKIGIHGYQDSVFVKDCFLLGLSMDQNYINNFMAYSLLKSLTIFNLAFSYCEVLINDKSQGIYLLIERPEDYAFKTLKSPVLIRRGFDARIDKIEVNNKDQTESLKYFRKKYMHMYTFCNKYSGTQLYDSLNSYIDLSMYMKWLGFNYLTRNGDYTDELNLYYHPLEKRFGIIPWDYDDLFMAYPHEGKEARNAVDGGQFIFSSEDILDRAIIGDEYLHKMYLKELLALTDQLNEEVVTEIFQRTYCFVYPYYLNNKIMETTCFDKYGSTNTDDLYSKMQEKLTAFLAMRLLVRKKLEPDSK